jgi:glutamate N-acetyltransferase/amino-acid N-acetyltransferase
MIAKNASMQECKGGVTAAAGFRAAGVKAAIKKWDKEDLGLILSDSPCSAAGAFTTNAVRAACVEWSQKLLPASDVRAIVCNSGNANACTGTQGVQDTRDTAKSVAKACGLKANQVLVASTGVIGRFMPMETILASVTPLADSLGASVASGTKFATAIMTTDTRLKEIALKLSLSGGSVTVGGCAKGSGMIHPNMATMLAFITTDAAVEQDILDGLVKQTADRTFNNLSVDGDTSTNDSLMVLANGASGVGLTNAADVALFEQGLFEVCNTLCAMIAADGEGATKRIEILVSGGKSEADAKLAAKAIANSNLVKTAIFGNDPNWGRILCAIGYSGARFSNKNIEVCIGGIPVCRALRPVDFPAKKMDTTLRKKVVTIEVNLGQGTATAIAQTCDLTYDYIKINADYTT